ncbi:MAG: hypothetical protein J0H01_19445 [Rhizobiales bacterium]|nr:hypothetical protein [Hyphomicrobiales bacterium]
MEGDETPFAPERKGLRREDCYFYHVMDVPGLGAVEGDWDLRGRLDAYLGGIGLDGRRVLEIGPASGFLTFEMEKRGAAVTAVEVTDEPGWDFVPFPSHVLDPHLGPRRDIMARLKNSWWFNHAAFGSKAKLIYGDVYDLPRAIGVFDIAVMGAVLLHLRAPLQVVEQCARRADTLVITDMYCPELEGAPVCRLVPDPTNDRWDTWWEFSTSFLTQFLGVMGFATVTTTHEQTHRGRTYTLFTIVARRERTPGVAPSPG